MSKIICNPLEIAYKYQHPLHGKYAYKEAADPTIIMFNDMYYLFTSKCGGFYYSKDLFTWNFHSDRNLEIHGYAPDVSVNDGNMYFCASAYTNKCKILRSKDPFKGFELVSKPFTFWDPHMYFENDKAYLYWGCSSKEPIYGIEMDKDTMTPIGEKFPLIKGDSINHGVDNKEIYKDMKRSLWDKYISLFTGSGTFIEGIYLNKINDVYYFQYATPGTEFPTYSNAVYLATSPKGDNMVWQKHNPVSIVPTGFIQGAGHGSTLFDKHGNLWHSASCCVGVNHNFERRLGLWPSGVDKDGIMFVNQYFSDYPHEIPDGKFDPLSIKPKYMLLSYRKRVEASSSIDNCLPNNVVDESIKTMWSSATNKEGEYLLIDLGKEYDVEAIQVNFGDYKTKKKKAPKSEYGGTISQERYIEKELVEYSYKLEVSSDGINFKKFEDETILTTLPHRLSLDKKEARYVKLTFIKAPYDQNFVISGLRVFGFDKDIELPKTIKSSAKRLDKTTGIISLKRKDDATGYVIKLGIAKDKLYTSIMLYDESEYKITFLNSEVDKYYYQIDSFNERGISEGEVNSF